MCAVRPHADWLLTRPGQSPVASRAVSVEPKQEMTSSDPEESLSVERWDEIIQELDAITHALSSIDGRLGSIDELLTS